MNQSTPLALLLALVGPAAAEAAFTAPVGYINGPDGAMPYATASGTIADALHPGMNLVGLRLHQSVIAAGRIAAIGADFAELTGLAKDPSGAPTLPLIDGRTYLLEIISGAKAGVIQEITRWQGARLTLADDLAAAGVKPGDGFAIRQAATLNSVFNPRSSGLRGGEDPDSADLVYIPQGAAFGDFRVCFIISAPDLPATWLDAATFKPVGDLPLVYPDGLVVQIKGNQPVSMGFTGQVKPGPTRSVVKPGLNLVATPYPVCNHLQGLGLENDLTKSDDLTQADQVWIPDAFGGGSFTVYFIAANGHWVNTATGEDVAAKIPVGSAILIDRKGPASLFCLGD